MLRIAALYMAGAFMSIYLYQIGYGIGHIALFWAAFFFFKVIISLPVASFVAKIGPKHAIFVSNILYIPAMILFALLPEYGPWLLVPILVLQAVSACMYAIAHTIDFSKVKSLDHAGKEIAYMNMIEKITTGVSPLIGGALAFFFGPQLVLIVAAMLFALAAVPLLSTGEQVKTGVKLTFRGFPWKLIRQHSIAQTSVGFDVFASGTVWTLYTAVVIIGISSSNNNVYIISGALLSVVLLAALASSYIYGRLIDKSRGGDLMRISVIFNALTHFIRPFVVSPVTVAGINAANEIATTGYTMPYTRAVFDNADLSGHRITYIGLIEVLGNLGAFLAAAALGILVLSIGETVALTNFFFIAGFVVLLVLTARFSLYKK